MAMPVVAHLTLRDVPAGGLMHAMMLLVWYYSFQYDGFEEDT